jgi:hypothetical protein
MARVALQRARRVVRISRRQARLLSNVRILLALSASGDAESVIDTAGKDTLRLGARRLTGGKRNAPIEFERPARSLGE